MEYLEKVIHFKIEVPSMVRSIVEVLFRNGFEAYVVGGAVRDSYLGKEPKDWDITTEAEPEEVLDLFQGSKIIGKRFPIVHIRYEEELYEVSTFRKEGNNYGSMMDDAYRRDFTINSMYYDVFKQEIIDPFRGLESLSKQRLEMIGNPIDRIKEDPVRLLRALQRVSEGYVAEDSLRTAMESTSNLLKEVNPSRLYLEFIKLHSNINNIYNIYYINTVYNIYTSIIPYSNNININNIIYIINNQGENSNVSCNNSMDNNHRDIPDIPESNKGDSNNLPDSGSVRTYQRLIIIILGELVWDRYSELLRSCIRDFNLDPIPSSQKAAKLLVEDLRSYMNMDKKSARQLKLYLSDKYRTENK